MIAAGRCQRAMGMGESKKLERKGRGRLNFNYESMRRLSQVRIVHQLWDDGLLNPHLSVVMDTFSCRLGSCNRLPSSVGGLSELASQSPAE
eukprot:634907-Amphidinium_carterae.1